VDKTTGVEARGRVSIELALFFVVEDIAPEEPRELKRINSRGVSHSLAMLRVLRLRIVSQPSFLVLSVPVGKRADRKATAEKR